MQIPNINGISVYDHEDKKFWSRQKILLLSKEMWESTIRDDDAEEYKNPSEELLLDYFKEEFDAYSSEESPFGFWDDAGRWELIIKPTYFGFGLWIEDNAKEMLNRIKQLSSIPRNTKDVACP